MISEWLFPAEPSGGLVVLGDPFGPAACMVLMPVDILPKMIEMGYGEWAARCIQLVTGGM